MAKELPNSFLAALNLASFAGGLHNNRNWCDVDMNGSCWKESRTRFCTHTFRDRQGTTLCHTMRGRVTYGRSGSQIIRAYEVKESEINPTGRNFLWVLQQQHFFVVLQSCTIVRLTFDFYLKGLKFPSDRIHPKLPYIVSHIVRLQNLENGHKNGHAHKKF